ncbi:right-handed parallel beta-helix repeat-containing protein [Geobacter hydrogenophilus]|nr:right-handed parallel beta-helix repeat-containing protein [Geobacter hydrogenophilus]MBT0894903.1 right-handed parallel beta-helix repeat-containing protein [Geobacter hydrogenophilus]
MRRSTMATIRMPLALSVLLWMAAFLGGCGTVSELFARGKTLVSPSAQVSVPAGASAAAVVKAESPPVPLAPSPENKPSVVPPQVISALPGISRITPRMDVPLERSYNDAVLTEDTVWSGEVFVEGSLTVAPQTTLTLEPGTVVRFRRTVPGDGAGPLLLVQGRLVVRGNADAPVRFTTSFPDPLAGEWQGIILLGSEKKNLLEQCRIEGAAAGIDASFSSVTLKQVTFAACGTGARFQDSIVTVSGGEASDNAVGMELVESESDIRDMVVRGNRLGITVRGGSLLLEGAGLTDNREAGLTGAASRLSISGTFSQGNGIGIVLTDCEGKVTGARIAENRHVGIHLVRSRVRVYGNEIVSNAGIGLRVEDGQGVAWGNAFSGNGRFDIENAGREDFRAIANWWGDPSPPLDMRLDHQAQDPARGRIFVNPVLKARPYFPALNSVAK